MGGEYSVLQLLIYKQATVAYKFIVWRKKKKTRAILNFDFVKEMFHGERQNLSCKR